jgi:hypothetical protein
MRWRKRRQPRKLDHACQAMWESSEKIRAHLIEKGAIGADWPTHGVWVFVSHDYEDGKSLWHWCPATNWIPVPNYEHA